MDDEVKVTRHGLYLCLLQWESEFRAGLTRSVEETAAMSAEQVAEESAAYLYAALQERAPA